MNARISLASLTFLLVAAAPSRSCVNEFSPFSFFDRIANLYAPSQKSPPPPTKAPPRPTTTPVVDMKARHLLKIIDIPRGPDWAQRERELRPVASAENADFRSRNDYA